MSDPATTHESAIHDKYMDFAKTFAMLNASGLQLPSFENLIGVSDVNFRRMMGDPGDETKCPQFREADETFRQMFLEHSENCKFESLVRDTLEIYRKTTINISGFNQNDHQAEINQQIERFSREYDDAKSYDEKETFIRRFEDVPTSRERFLAIGSFLAGRLLFVQEDGKRIVMQYVNFVSNPDNVEGYNALMRVCRRDIRDYYNNVLQKQDAITTEVCHFPKPVFSQGFRILPMNGFGARKFQISTFGGLTGSFNIQMDDEIELKASLVLVRESEGGIHCAHVSFPVYRWHPVSTVFKYVFIHTKTSFDPTNSVDAECLIARGISPFITELNVYMNRLDGLYRITFVMILIPAMRK